MRIASIAAAFVLGAVMATLGVASVVSAQTPPVPISSAVTVQCNADGTISVNVVKK